MSDSLVLCYHALSDDFPVGFSTRPALFEAHLHWLRRLGYHGVTFSQAVNGAGRRAVAITFDDAYRSVLDRGLPILDRIGWPATVFAPTDFIGSPGPMSWPEIQPWIGGPHEHELLALDWDSLRELADRGWEIGSHTCSHPHLTLIDDGRLADELDGSRERCEEALGRACTTLAYPYGDVDDRVVRAADRARYHAAAALPARPHPAQLLEWPRVGVYAKDGLPRFALKAAAAARRARLAAQAGRP